MLKNARVCAIVLKRNLHLCNHFETRIWTTDLRNIMVLTLV
jgi:hypothetical protein